MNCALINGLLQMEEVVVIVEEVVLPISYSFKSSSPQILPYSIFTTLISPLLPPLRARDLGAIRQSFESRGSL